MRRLMLSLLAMAALLGGGPTVEAQSAPGGMRYLTGYNVMMKLGLDLFKMLNPQYQDGICPQPISLETDVTPFVKCETLNDEGRELGFVFVSAGFIDLVNNVAHAKAIDGIEKGYFAKYIQSLARETGEMELQELPNVGNPKYWTEDLMNEQQSNFRQMVGTVVALKLSHHYKNHYGKYKDRLQVDGKTVPINTLLTPAEWDESFRAGVIHALNAGLGVEGVIALFESIDKMPSRPMWTEYFVPRTANVKTLIKDMKRLNERFFNGEDLENEGKKKRR